MPRLSYDGTLSYNGFTFPDQRNVRCIAQPVKDTSGRSNKYINYTLTVECIIQPGDAPTSTIGAQVDDNMENIRDRLLAPGKILIFTDDGFGNDINVNASNDMWDSTFGPHPELLVWEPAGANRACHIIWTVEFRIPECINTPLYENALCEFSYDVHWTINEGVTTRTITGTIEIPAHRVGSGISDTIDAYREMIRFDPPMGFKRDVDIGISRDKRTMEYRITDTQIDSDNPYFPGCRLIEAEHDVESSLVPGGFRQWQCTISATIRIAEGFSRSLAWFVFLTIVQSRLDKSFFGQVKAKDIRGNQIVKQSWHLPTRVRIRERLFRREFQFSFSYWLFSTLHNVISGVSSGLFHPIPGTNWGIWTASMSKAHSLRGNAQMGHIRSDDALIDLCSSGTPPAGPQALQMQSRYDNAQVFTPRVPAPQQSWLKYHNEFEIREDNQVVVHRQTDLVQQNIVSSQQNNQGDQANVVDMQNPQAQKPKIQVRGSNVYYARMHGHAMRGAYKIPMPVLISVGGIRAIRCKPPIWSHTTLIPSETCPIYAAQWDIEYVLDGKPPPGDVLATFATDGHVEDKL